MPYALTSLPAPTASALPCVPGTPTPAAGLCRSGSVALSSTFPTLTMQAYRVSTTGSSASSSGSGATNTEPLAEAGESLSAPAVHSTAPGKARNPHRSRVAAPARAWRRCHGCLTARTAPWPFLARRSAGVVRDHGDGRRGGQAVGGGQQADDVRCLVGVQGAQQQRHRPFRGERAVPAPTPAALPSLGAASRRRAVDRPAGARHPLTGGHTVVLHARIASAASDASGASSNAPCTLWSVSPARSRAALLL